MSEWRDGCPEGSACTAKVLQVRHFAERSSQQPCALQHNCEICAAVWPRMASHNVGCTECTDGVFAAGGACCALLHTLCAYRIVCKQQQSMHRSPKL